jgi:Tripartite tricarboxylate transporter family receptor
MLPPLGLAAMLPVACRRCIHLIAELGLTSNQSAAARRDAPDSTASTTRSRNSKEHGFGIDPPSKIRINAASFNHPSPPRNPDSTQPKSALVSTGARASPICLFEDEQITRARGLHRRSPSLRDRPALYEKLNFNFIRDIAPIAGLSREPAVMVVHPSVPAKTVPEFIAYAKANPGKINFASGGIGAPSHVFGELFKMLTGVSMVHVPYRGAG